MRNIDAKILIKGTDEGVTVEMSGNEDVFGTAFVWLCIKDEHFAELLEDVLEIYAKEKASIQLIAASEARKDLK